ncbi:prion-like-(Q/N-rich) domain-bearing protein 25 [Anthonomus grandis grandis]|uniref:prion-like-(Q/N-rich) domain-bearing protein 25 n=1 Tax=Anthonomus grandis grandis TaxID=2921223 RepID=UPI0021665FD8|nr:prion-like-(Q/N-rich) domain-bearing protein 25 [Anthonomus grandis grandis]
MKHNAAILFFGFIAVAKGSNLSNDTNHVPLRPGISPCITDSDCSDIKNAKCVSFVCACDNNQTCAEPIVESKIVTKLDGICTTSADCNIEYSECKEGMCKCKSGKIGSEDQRRCLTISTGLGSSCQEAVQCYTKVPLSHCQVDKCTCQENTHDYNGKCYKNVELDGTCAHIGECSVTTFARCIENKCTCEDGYIPNNSSTKCLEIAKKPNDICYEDIQCKKNLGRAVCKQGFCQCEELFQFKKSKGICVRDLQIDELCDDHSDCRGIEEGESRLECILGTCKCRSTFVEDLGFCIGNGGLSVFGNPISPIFYTVSLLLYVRI